jgi:hypothetical protein
MTEHAESDPWQPDLAERTSRLEKVKLANAPSPVIARIEQLCDLVDEADGIRPDRQELIAALIHAAKPDGKSLAATWAKYRTAPVHALLMGESRTSGRVDLRRFKKGG